jgi:ring-1,2-phenylacetyl-CoA epoxidase subunit PaaD
VVAALSLDGVAALVAALPDPELPQVTIGDLGMVRSVEVHGDRVEVVVTPTYTACPATEAICADIEALLHRAGAATIRVRVALAPAWTSDDISAQGRAKLLAAGIAAPCAVAHLAAIDLPPPCPRCGSRRTRLVSRFGATACKSAHVCGACHEPFEAFKAI